MITVNHFRQLILAAFAVMLMAVAGCSSVRHVPDGSYMVDKVRIDVADNRNLKSADLVNYLRQTPNHKVLGFAKLQLATYNMSGRDSTKWYNRWIRRMGQPPVIYSRELTEASRQQLRQALINKGYMGARVDVDTIFNAAKKKAEVTYHVYAGEPHRITSVNYEIADTALARVIDEEKGIFSIKPGDLLDRNNLDAERAAVTGRLRQRGYYAFAKESITFTADTAAGSHDVGLTVEVHRPVVRTPSGVDTLRQHMTYHLRNIWYVTDVHHPVDTVEVQPGIFIVYGDNRYISSSALLGKSFLEPGNLYSATAVDRTYESLSRLGILRSIQIEMKPVGELGDMMLLDTYVVMNRNKTQGLVLELEGTNSEGDLGFGVGVTYQHRNISHASNILTAKARVNYESLSGNLDGLINDRYTEYAGELGLTFPKFVFPFLSKDYLRRVRATSEMALSFNYQERPEYTRIIAGAAWKYKWSLGGGQERRTLDLIDINYVYLPERTIDFIEQIAPNNPLLRYSYEDHFIMRMGYTYYWSNKRAQVSSLRRTAPQRRIFTLRAAVEVAGNALYAFSKLSGQKRHEGVYDIFGIAYSQYAKAEIDYTITHNYGLRHSLAFHVGAGIGYPYGNSRVLPFEKRFYAGGANGVRGWSVRTLGPGSYDSRNSVIDFINQCGDIRLDLNLEYRAKLFWVLEGAAFVDAGNIWTIHNYETQPGGMFHFDTFWKQIAAAYGVGLRMDFSYFLIRLDLGLKAHNPARGQEQWPIIHPRWRRDATFHFSVGYPF